ncbi:MULTISPECIES: hypothetical protein [unclassified Dysgonomonas]|uniref:hypothetical protein n=1 Tax=unclassified Dysgonomonas TaxID=2630389 RepID=UPI00068256DD|nr:MULTISPECIES: hypothetical protein [unclassified Dysgonomonas]MBD8347035.1 hypothetical protein [Dysgonomonas sp. HGC4]MBF0574785.1 hypothetical protein [Dysgonomonas sp. GY617]
MKIKTLLIAISCTIFLFTSCEKDEMGKGITDGGGKADSISSLNSGNKTIDNNAKENDTDSLSYKSNNLLGFDIE